MQLKNKIALITGASSGIGKEIAKKFAEEGALVILTSRNPEKLKIAQEEIEKNNCNADSFVMDTTNRKQINSVVSKIIKKYKKIDLLVNNAGIAKWNSIEDVSYEEFDAQISVNLTGYFNCIKEIVPYMLQKKSGTIINIVSGSGKRARPGTVAYTASKFGAAGLSDAVFEDVQDKGINVTAIYPGRTNTPIHKIPENDPRRKTMLKTEEIAKLALYIATLPQNVKIKEISIRPLE